MAARKVIHTDNAPQAIGPYSQAVRVGSTVYLSGQIPLDPATMTLDNASIEHEIRRVFANLLAVVDAAGGSVTRLPAPPTSAAIDTTGAGDAFVGAFVHGLARGLDERHRVLERGEPIVRRRRGNVDGNDLRGGCRGRELRRRR